MLTTSVSDKNNLALKDLQSRRVALVIHGGHDVLHALDVVKWFAAVNVPSDFIEHGSGKY